MRFFEAFRVQWRLALLGASGFTALLVMEFAGRAHITARGIALETSELALTVGTAVAAALLTARVQRNEQERELLLQDLDSARAEGEHWRAQAKAHLDGLGAAIEKQLRLWRLTDAESEVALLMLKGFSHKEVASLRGTSEATVRQQARAVYEKTGLSGRAAFCAFFLEDLLPPVPAIAPPSE
jgi:DNA-binding NarL/FixJ family response regulator